LAPTIAADHSGALFYARRFDEARVQADRALDLQPEHPWALLLSSLLAIRRGQYDEATRYADRFEAVLDEGAHLCVLAATGREEEMRALVEEKVDRLGGRERIEPRFAVTLGTAFATLGDVDEAIGWLEHAVDRGYAAGGESLLGWPPFDPLRDDPRYQVLLERMGYPR
jgi:tetratricopeptide (TPR) repeat protein